MRKRNRYVRHWASWYERDGNAAETILERRPQWDLRCEHARCSGVHGRMTERRVRKRHRWRAGGRCG